MCRRSRDPTSSVTRQALYCADLHTCLPPAGLHHQNKTQNNSKFNEHDGPGGIIPQNDIRMKVSGGCMG